MKSTTVVSTGLVALAAFFVTSYPLAAQAGRFTLVSPDEAVWKITSATCDYADEEKIIVRCDYTLAVDGTPALSHLGIQILDGVTAETDAPNSELGRDNNLDAPYSDDNYIKWEDGQDDGEKIYTVDFQNAPVGAVCNAVMKGGQDYTVVEVPCGVPDIAVNETTYSVSGTVFMDADWSGANESEPGLSNVTVELHDSLGNVVAAGLTSESGGYEFTGLQAGDYRLVVQPENAQDDFNELLTDYFVPTTETEITLSALSEDSAGNDFGFAPDTAAILDDFDQEDQDGNGVVFQGNGKTIGFWKHQNKVADSGKGKAQVDAVTLQGYIDAIEELLLPEPFQFDDANEYLAAHDVMAQQTSDAVELLRKQLLGTEFNDVSGRGLEAPYDQLQDKIIALAEHLVANNGLFTRDELLAVKDICDLINNSGNR
jgi:hypothetical protein